jgi:probable F420-dependent oxidoreductase
MVSDSEPRLGLCVFATDIEAMVAAAAAADGAGFDSVWTSELYNRSATVTIAACATETSRCALGTGILYGVGRSPLMLAAEARDLDELSHGRFVLGIGNGTRRMISDWHGLDGDAPAVRLEELIPLVRQVWNLHEGPIRHEGRFYRLKIAALDDLAGAPPRAIPIYAAGVNPRMVEAAGRVADGLLGHTMFTPDYVEQVVRPALARGAEHAGRAPEDIALATYVLASCSEDEVQARRDAAAMIAFYATVKSYAPMFEVAGFGEAARAVQAAFAARDVAGMLDAVGEDMVDALALAGTPEQVRAGLRRFDGVVDELVLSVPSFQVPADRVAENLRLLTAACGPSAG